MTTAEIDALVARGLEMKATRGSEPKPLSGQCWALIFSKSSTRTRVSFEVGVRELGGTPMYLSARDLQLGRGEPIADTARVLGRMVHGAIIRTYAQEEVDQFAHYADIPTINALTDEEHPCQVLADLMTMREFLGGWNDRKVAYLGDADNNMARSWIWAAARLGFQLVLAAPEACQPAPELLAAAGGNISVTDDPEAAASEADLLYTDVWVSMGQEDQATSTRETLLLPYQVNETLLAKAKPGALVQHCLPAYRDKEISASLLEARANEIFTQAENRLHVQKAILESLATAREARA